MAEKEPTPVADESTAVAANMAGDSVTDESMLEPDLAGEPGTMSEREALTPDDERDG
jgi:hypothetical protein